MLKIKRNKIINNICKCVFILFIVLIVSCSQQENDASYSRPLNIQSVLAKDFYTGQLEAHYIKHKDEFGNITMEQYLSGAKILLNSLPGKDILEKSRENGDVLRYRISTGEFAVMTKDGRIRTYFKTNYKYWLKQ
jgi:hypothetical protein